MKQVSALFFCIMIMISALSMSANVLTQPMELNNQSNNSRASGSVIEANGIDWIIEPIPLETSNGNMWLGSSKTLVDEYYTQAISADDLGVTYYLQVKVDVSIGTIKHNSVTITTIEDNNFTQSTNSFESELTSTVIDSTIASDGSLWYAIYDWEIINGDPERYVKVFRFTDGIFELKYESPITTFPACGRVQEVQHFGLNIVSRLDGTMILNFVESGCWNYEYVTTLIQNDGTGTESRFDIDSDTTRLSRSYKGSSPIVSDSSGNIWLCIQILGDSDDDDNNPRLQLAKIDHNWNGVGQIPWSFEELPVDAGNFGVEPSQEEDELRGDNCVIAAESDGTLHLVTKRLNDRKLLHLVKDPITNDWTFSILFEGFPDLQGHDSEWYSIEINNHGEIFIILRSSPANDGNNYRLYLYLLDSSDEWNRIEFLSADNPSLNQWSINIRDRIESSLDSDGNLWITVKDEAPLKFYRTFFDSDLDGIVDDADEFPNDVTQWSDSDSDGFGDQANGNSGDDCLTIFGNSTADGVLGCPDYDGDGYADSIDLFYEDDSEWYDLDKDGMGDNSDAFPSDGTQYSDSDNDGFGDYIYGNGGDSCPATFGTSVQDRYGCPDADGDSVSDLNDAFVNDPSKWKDSDEDGYEDSEDMFPFDPTQWNDADGDGYGDNENGNRADLYPNDSTKQFDSDRDGIDDSSDDFPFDPTQSHDRDGDGMGDNPMGIGADKFPDDNTQWGDIDGDGYGDNPAGTNADVFITDATQWSDIDGDGYGDNPAGRLYDQFPENPTQWEDQDEDGLGDNQSGTDADPYLNDFDNDGFNDSIDILPKLSSPGDLDADGCLDEVDIFPDNARECYDADLDGIGDNEDTDDDNDGWSDTEEDRLNTDPFSSAEQPVDSFEFVLPGSTIGLGAWDLIGIFGGVPLFAWLLFGFTTRNGRAGVLEERMKNAMSREELEEIALRSEYLLMLRLLGPHQGIRLERIRAELDDALTDSSMRDEFSMDYHDPVVNSSKPLPYEHGDKDDDGYEWITRDDGSWYRVTGSNSEWEKWTN